MVNAALEYARLSKVTLEMPPVCEGIKAEQLVATFFLWSMESPFALYLAPFYPSPLSPLDLTRCCSYRFVTNPLNVHGTRSTESLQQQLPLIKLLCIAHRSIPRKSPFWCPPHTNARTLIARA
jgi:hypothetical protein